MKLCVIGCLLCSVLFGQILYEEHFTGGSTQLAWAPWVEPSTMTVINDPTTPGGDSWAGIVANDSAPIAAMYAGEYTLADYSVEAWIYANVLAAMGPYNGVCIRIDTSTNSLYQLVSDFDSDARLRLRHIIGATPSVIRDWTSAEIPGGVPAASSWHKFKLRMIADSIWAYYDDVMLPDCPFIDNRVAQGFFGIYFFSILGGSTKCDDIIASGPTGIFEYGSQEVNAFKVYPNPFRNTINIRYSILDSRYLMENPTLRIYDATGRLVKSFHPESSIPGLAPRSGAGQNLESEVQWDGCDAAGNGLAPGVYFIKDELNNLMEKVVKVR